MEDRIVSIPDVVLPNCNSNQTQSNDFEDSQQNAFYNNAPTEMKKNDEIGDQLSSASQEPPVPELTREELIELYSDELQSIVQQEVLKARQMAVEEVKAEERGRIQEMLRNTDATLQLMQEQQNLYLQRYADELKFFAIDIAEKLIQQKLKANDTLMIPLIQDALQDFHNASWLEIEVSNQLTQLVEVLQQELENSRPLGSSKVIPSSANIDTCRITAEEETLVATISVQAENLRKAFQNPLESLG